MEYRKDNIIKNTNSEKYRKRGGVGKVVENLIGKDYKDSDNSNLKKYGQDVSGTYPSAHFFVNTSKDLDFSIERFVDILFGYPYHTPTKDERNMFAAKGVALRSADLSRQVGAVVTNTDGDIIATGCNEVPKFGGGFYEPDDSNDMRDFRKSLEMDFSVQGKIELISNTIEKLNKVFSKKIGEIKDGSALYDIYNKLDKAGAQITELLEFGRPVHAELACICDAARRGVSIRGAIMYCTTYPCHLCMKHILAVGIQRVVYIEPYPKSMANDLFGEAISGAREKNKILLDSFVGISPRRYLHVFRWDKGRKESNKINIKKAERTEDSPYLETKHQVDYKLREACVIRGLYKMLKEKNIEGIEELGKINNELSDYKKFDNDGSDYWKCVAK